MQSGTLLTEQSFVSCNSATTDMLGVLHLMRNSSIITMKYYQNHNKNAMHKVLYSCTVSTI